jgi:hypothetical protein
MNKRLLAVGIVLFASMISKALYTMEQQENYYTLPVCQCKKFTIFEPDYSAAHLLRIHNTIYRALARYTPQDMLYWFDGCIEDFEVTPSMRMIQKSAAQKFNDFKGLYDELVATGAITSSPHDTVLACAIKMHNEVGLEMTLAIINAVGMHYKNIIGDGLLHLAVRAHNQEIICWLLQQARRQKITNFIAMRNNNHQTALGIAYEIDDENIIRLLIEDSGVHIAPLAHAPSVSRETLKERIFEELS